MSTIIIDLLLLRDLTHVDHALRHITYNIIARSCESGGLALGVRCVHLNAAIQQGLHSVINGISWREKILVLFMTV